MITDQNYDIIIAGAGIVGLSTAYQLLNVDPRLKIAVLEKEKNPGEHQTGRNSGVIHSGLYYKPGSLKAANCVEGRKLLIEFARQEKIPHEICGKIVVATDEKEIPHLEKIYHNGQQNGLKGLKKLSSADIPKYEPYCQGVSAIHVPETGIINFGQVALRLAEKITKSHGSKILTSHPVQNLTVHKDHTEITAGNQTFKCRNFINCAGLYSDKIAKMAGIETGAQIVPFRGDFYSITQKAEHKIRHLIYPVPDPAFPFLGVHFTRKIDGMKECGPNATFVLKKEGYSRVNFNLNEAWDALTYKGTLKLFSRHWQKGIEEYRRAFSKKAFLHALQRLIPDLHADDIEKGRCGVRAVALDKEGNLIDDFKLLQKDSSLHLINAPSPAATACLSIGKQLSEKVL